jgi:hypothetical protein
MPRRRTFEAPIYTFRVRLLGGPYPPPEEQEVWRDIAVASNQTLADLGNAIPLAFDFWDLHLWSFFFSGKAWDRSTEYALSPGPEIFDEEEAKRADRLRIADMPLVGKKSRREILYIFDYGDEWHFGVRFLGASEAVEPGKYPRVVGSQGAAPEQYGDMEGWEEEDEWEEEEDEEP